jgi:predicted HD superfamily hydrolase involved in NAD metabolism
MEFGPLLERLYSSVMTELSDKRRIHTLGVKDTAIALAKKYGADPLKAEVAALAHDLYRGLRGEDLNKTVRDLGLDEKYLDDPNLAHSKIASIMLREKYGVEDSDILNAVSFHTTGRRNMSTLEKVVFLADAIEPGRNYPGVEDIRKAAEKGLDEGCLCSMLGTIRHVQEQGAYLDEDTIEAAEFLKENK